MRYAVVSDIHGNLQAWNTVVADAAVRGVERILCLGDVVGYGPQPAETLRSVHAKCAAFVVGNHDAAICGRMSPEAFNDRAKRSIEWSKRQLGKAAVSFFADLPLAILGDGVRCTHGSAADPASFAYVRTEDDAAEAFRAVPEQLLFCGHTHEQALFVIGRSGVAHKTEPRDFALEDGKRYLVNVGSVGSPRGGDPRACYAIWDDSARSVFFVRVSFDLDSFRSAVAAASGGVDPLLPGDVPLLAAASSATVDAVREETDFAPSGSVRAVSSGTGQDEIRLEELSRKVSRKMRFSAAFAAAGCVAAAVAAVLAVRAMRGPGLTIPSWPIPEIPLSQTGGPDGNLLPVLNPSRTGGFSCVPYRIDLGHAGHQAAWADEAWHVALQSIDSVRPMRFCAPDIECTAGQKVEAFAKVRFSADFQGSFELVASLVKDDGTEKTLFSRSFSRHATGISDSALPTTIRALRPSDGWMLARGTSDGVLPPGTSCVRIEVGGHFTGTATVGALAARRK